MLKRIAATFLMIFFGLSAGTSAFADGGAKPVLNEEQAIMPESAPAPSGNYGEILFGVTSPESRPSESQPNDERHSVSVGDSIQICVRFSKEASPYVDRLAQNGIGFRLVLEDSDDPPHRMNIILGNHLERMRPDQRGCYGGTWEIPSKIVPGVYQVSDLLWATRDQSYYSLRSHLYEFSRVEELDVQNPKADAEPPKLVEIKTFGQTPYQMKRTPGVLRVRVEQTFLFQDKASGIDKKSLVVFYKLLLNGVEKGLKDAQCKTMPIKGSFRCILTLTNPEVNWGLSQVTLTLESVSIQDQAGNRLSLNGEEEICAAAPDSITSMEFERRQPWPDKAARDLANDPPIPQKDNF